MLMKLSLLDFAIIAAYFIVVLGVGYWLKGQMKTSSDFLLSKRNFSHWITGIAFMSANLGALEVMGHCGLWLHGVDCPSRTPGQRHVGN
jgi:SSS family solute:Na+ symporter